MKHLTDIDISRFYSHSMNGVEETSLLCHISKCDYCAARLSSNFPENELLTPPPGLQDEILNAARQIPTHREMKLEFYRYSTKVVLAMAMSLSLLVLGNFSKIVFNSAPINIESLSEKNTSAADIDAEKKAYEETIKKQKEERDEKHKQFIAEKQEKNRQEQKDKDTSDRHGDFLSDLLSHFKK